MASSDDWVQAIFTVGPTHDLPTEGWLPRSALTTARGDDASRSPALPGTRGWGPGTSMMGRTAPDRTLAFGHPPIVA